MTKYLTNSPKWQKMWYTFWDEKFKSVADFSARLAQLLGKPVGTINAALSHFKKGEEEVRINYFLEDVKRRECFLTALGMPLSDLEKKLKEIVQNAGTVSLGNLLYPNFEVELQTMDQGWIFPTISISKDRNDPIEDLSKFEQHYDRKKIVLLKAKTGKTRFLEYLQIYGNKSDKIQYEHFHPDWKRPEEYRMMPSDSQKMMLLMLDSNEQEFRKAMIPLYEQYQKISLLMFFDEQEDINNVIQELGLNDQQTNDRQLVRNQKKLEIWDMEILLKKETALKVLETLEQAIPETSPKETFQQIKKLITTEGGQFPIWCNTLDSFTKTLKILIENASEMNWNQCTFENLPQELLAINVASLIPSTLSNRKARAMSLLASFSALWLEKSLQIGQEEKSDAEVSVSQYFQYSRKESLGLIENPMIYKSFLLKPAQELFRYLWEKTVTQKKIAMDSEIACDLWEELDKKSPRIDKLRESLWPWKLNDVEELVNICLQSPIFIDSDHLGRWLNSLLIYADPSSLEPLFPSLAYYPNDGIVDSLHILEILFGKKTILVKSKAFQKTLDSLHSIEHDLLVLTAAAATDHIPCSQIEESWCKILTWWDNINKIQQNKTEDATRSDISLSEGHYKISQFIGKFPEKHIEILRQVSSKYRDVLPYVSMQYPLGMRGSQEKPADWFQWARFRLTADAPLVSRISYNSIEFEPLQWLADKGNQIALNIFSGEDEAPSLFRDSPFRYSPDQCWPYLGKGVHGWEAEKLPSILLAHYLECPRLAEWYQKLPLFSRKIFFCLIFLGVNRLGFSEQTLRTLCQMVQKENPEFFRQDTWEAIFDQAFDQFVGVSRFDKVTKTSGFSLSQNALPVLLEYFPENLYEEILGKIFTNEGSFYKKNGFPDNYYFQDLEVSHELLLCYLNYAIQKCHPSRIENFLGFLEAYANQLMEFPQKHAKLRVQRPNQPHCFQDLPTEYMRWWQEKWGTGFHPQDCKNIVLRWGFDLFYKALLATKLTLKAKLQIIEILYEHPSIFSFFHYQIPQYLGVSQFSEQEKRKFHLWLLDKLIEACQNGQLSKSLFENLLDNLYLEKIDFLWFLRNQKQEYYETIRKNYQTKWNNYFIVLKDETVFPVWINDKKIDLIIGPEISPWQKYLDTNWWVWFFAQIEKQTPHVWPEIINRIGFIREIESHKEMLTSLIDCLCSLPLEIQIQRFQQIYAKTGFYTEPAYSWLLRILEKDFVPYHSQIEAIIPFDELCNRIFLRVPSFLSEKNLQRIRSLLEKSYSWLDWSPQQCYFPTLWINVLIAAENSLTQKQDYTLLLKWFQRQIIALKMLEISLWQDEDVTFFQQLVYLMPTEAGIEFVDDVYVLGHQDFPKLFMPSKWHFPPANIVQKIVCSLFQTKRKSVIAQMKKDIADLIERSQKISGDDLYDNLDVIDIFASSFLENKDIDGYDMLLQKTLDSPLELKVLSQYTYFLAGSDKPSPETQKLWEFYLRQYIQPTDLAVILRYFFYAETIIEGLIAPDALPKFSRHEPLGKLAQIPFVFQKLGFHSLLEIAIYRCRKSPAEKPLWYSLLKNFFPNHPQKNKIAQIMNMK